MSTSKVENHRAGDFKQINKSHKHGRYRSKSSLRLANKGKTECRQRNNVKRKRTELNRDQRRHQAFQVRRAKRADTLIEKRGLGGSTDGTPLLVCVIPLHQQLNLRHLLSLTIKCASEDSIQHSDLGATHIFVARLKQRYTFIMPSSNNSFLSVLDSLKLSDCCVFVTTATSGFDESCMIDDWGEKILTSAIAQGIATPLVAMSDLELIPLKKRNDYKQFVSKVMSKWIPDLKVLSVSNEDDVLNLLRRIGVQKYRHINLRINRPYLYADEFVFIPNATGSKGTLQLTGYLRGATLCVNNLIYIPQLGSFQISQIAAVNDLAHNQPTVELRVLAKADPSEQESLIGENTPAPMDAEQTWPTQEELDEAIEQQNVKRMKRVPKGWSDYQATWIPDDSVQRFSDAEDSDEFVDVAASDDSSSVSEDHISAETDSEVAAEDAKYDVEMSAENEQKDLNKIRAAKIDHEFPDEVDTPQDVTARVRFQKYRGLESFRSSPWDPKENLPFDYARIFQFQNFTGTKRSILKMQESNGDAYPGCYIKVDVSNVPKYAVENCSAFKHPFEFIGLWPHEQKMTVVNVLLRRTSNNCEPIKSKDRLFFQCGFRRFSVCPIFSEHTNGNKHKFIRFFQAHSFAVATFYAPVQFSPGPILCYKSEANDNDLELIATGTLLSCNPDRIVLKRIVLSGHPFKIHRRSAIIRFMFFNREDILYFKPCKLRTKCGRVGHIKDPLGTHGHMKCIFDGQLSSSDTVLLNIYKRVFPKWNYEELLIQQ